ncbi:hypothetical protein L0F63_004948 [Massospora cicadina]|nr:hypothetical protein L0F63_004948 [Massospora cicadina]
MDQILRTLWAALPRARYDSGSLSDVSTAINTDYTASSDSEAMFVDQDESEAVNLPSRNGMVSHEAIIIPFGENEVESLLAYQIRAESEEFLVKFKHTSYHHVKWLSWSMIESGSPGNKARVKRFLEMLVTDPCQNEEPIKPLHLEIDRLLDEGELEDPAAPDGYYVYVLVKWCGLPYEASTWERIEFVQELSKERFDEFTKLQEPPDDTFPVVAPIPPISEFVKPSESTLFRDSRLRDYQLDGLNWLAYCWHMRQPCILADEMGLGKKVQVVSFLYHVYHTFQVRGPFLIVVPLSTLPLWEQEARTWTTLNVVVYHGSPLSRNLIVDTEFYYKDEDGNRVAEHFKFEVLITTYEMLQSGASHLRPLPWRIGVFDAAHRLKDRNLKLLETLKSYRFEHRVLLTSTPLQGSGEELYNLVNFLRPESFDDEKKLIEESGSLESETAVDPLQALLKPLMLQRFREDVRNSLLDRDEVVIEVELTAVQRSWYRAIFKRNFTWLRGGHKGEGPSLNNILMELWKCYNHPYLIQGAEDLITQEAADVSDAACLQTLIQASGKLVLLDKLLPKLHEGGHKVLIFSRMTRMLDILASYLNQCGYNAERIDDKVKSHERHDAINRFSSSPDSFVFLLCSRASGLGINLIADTVVLFDSDWNPQNDLQALARVHLADKFNLTKIYRLLSSKTCERWVFDQVNLKLSLDGTVMQHLDLSTSFGFSKKEVEDLLKLGAYGALLDGDDESFCAESIDQIIDHRSVVVEDLHIAKGYASSNPTFAADANIDDPEFWDKWAKLANFDPAAANPHFIDEPHGQKCPLLYHSNLKDPPASEDSDVENLLKPWSNPERLRLGKQLLIFGISNFERLKEAFPHRSVADLEACIMELLGFLRNAKEDDELKGWIDQLLVAMPLPFKEWMHLQQSGIPFPNATSHQIAEFCSFLREAPADYKERMVRKSRQLLKRMHTIYLIYNKVDLSNLTPSSIDTQAALPAKWWCFQADRDFLIGIKKHGFMQLAAIQNDPALYFSQLKFDAPSPNHSAPPTLHPLQHDGLTVSWPSTTELNARLCHIIACVYKTDIPKLLTNSQARAQNYIQDQIVALRNGTELDYEIELDPTWSNKEHKNFLRLLSSFGLETRGIEVGNWNWARFRILGELNNKSPGNLDTYTAYFLTTYRGILYGSGGDTLHNKNTDVVQFFDQLMEATPTPMEEFAIDMPTPEKVKRVIKRIMLMHTIRHKVHPVIHSLHLSVRIPAGFPPWWAPKFDVALVEAVGLYGITREDLIFADLALPFHHQNLTDWPKEGHLIKHLESLIELLHRSKRPTHRLHTSALHHPTYSWDSSLDMPHASSRPTNFVVYDSPQGPILVNDPNYPLAQSQPFPRASQESTPKAWISPSPSVGLPIPQRPVPPTSPSF